MGSLAGDALSSSPVTTGVHRIKSSSVNFSILTYKSSLKVEQESRNDDVTCQSFCCICTNTIRSVQLWRGGWLPFPSPVGPEGSDTGSGKRASMLFQSGMLVWWTLRVKVEGLTRSVGGGIGKKHHAVNHNTPRYSPVRWRVLRAFPTARNINCDI